MARHDYHPSYYMGKHKQEIMVQAGPRKIQDPFTKVTNAKGTSRVAQAIEGLPKKCQALSSAQC
jgi:hypothetical protein